MAVNRRIGRVRAVDDVTARVRRLVIEGPDMASFATPAGALGPYLKFCFAKPSGEPLLRTYSIRRFDPGACEIHVDVVLHEGGSLGSAFAARARPGAEVALAGPGFIPAEPCGAYLLAGDHTALPAMAHILDTLPGGPTVHAILEVPDRSEEQALRLSPATRITWLHRSGSAPSRLAEAVRDAYPAGTDDLLVWAGAEAGIARAIRAHARCERLIPAERCQVLNYWHRGRPEGGFSYVG